MNRDQKEKLKTLAVDFIGLFFAPNELPISQRRYSLIQHKGVEVHVALYKAVELMKEEPVIWEAQGGKIFEIRVGGSALGTVNGEYYILKRIV